MHLTWQPWPKLYPGSQCCLDLWFFTCFQIYLHRLQKYSYPKASCETQVQPLGMWAKFCLKSVVNMDELRGSGVREPSALLKWGGDTSEDVAMRFAVSDLWLPSFSLSGDWADEHTRQEFALPFPSRTVLLEQSVLRLQDCLSLLCSGKNSKEVLLQRSLPFIIWMLS